MLVLYGEVRKEKGAPTSQPSRHGSIQEADGKKRWQDVYRLLSRVQQGNNEAKLKEELKRHKRLLVEWIVRLERMVVDENGSLGEVQASDAVVVAVEKEKGKERKGKGKGEGKGVKAKGYSLSADAITWSPPYVTSITRKRTYEEVASYQPKMKLPEPVVLKVGGVQCYTYPLPSVTPAKEGEPGEQKAGETEKEGETPTPSTRRKVSFAEHDEVRLYVPTVEKYSVPPWPSGKGKKSNSKWKDKDTAHSRGTVKEKGYYHNSKSVVLVFNDDSQISKKAAKPSRHKKHADSHSHKKKPLQPAGAGALNSQRQGGKSVLKEKNKATGKSQGNSLTEK
ncbi:hypothetical protein G7Y89_g12634 [Cudoniella acicularis]|uniref:Uncharacterized protein n=1 Tax=Cudoniella acicularis TaxID=354080 RepID=A0A8H4R8R7_9HELO|nr:hypothetical protein G7Y89_g12634 [Cudoniella acicularis]